MGTSAFILSIFWSVCSPIRAKFFCGAAILLSSTSLTLFFRLYTPYTTGEAVWNGCDGRIWGGGGGYERGNLRWLNIIFGRLVSQTAGRTVL